MQEDDDEMLIREMIRSIDQLPRPENSFEAAVKHALRRIAGRIASLHELVRDAAQTRKDK